MESRGYESAFLKAKATAQGISSRPRKKSLPLPTAPSNPPEKDEFIFKIQNSKPLVVPKTSRCTIKTQQQKQLEEEQEREHIGQQIFVDRSKLSESEWQKVKTEALNMNKNNRKNFGFPSSSSSLSLVQQKYKHKSTNTLSSVMRSGKAVLDSAKLNAVDCGICFIDSIRTEHIKKVHTLYLSNNNIATLDGIEAYSNVETLSLTNNQITYLHQLKTLRHLGRLRKLSMVGNPILEMPYFKQRLLLFCPNLQTLDGKAITRDDHNEASTTASSATITTEQLMLNELRNTILSHVSKVTAMQTELLYEVCGRYAAIRGGDLPGASEGTQASMDRSGTIIRRLLQGGCFYMLQIGCREHFDVMLQDLCRIASQILRRTNTNIGGINSNNNRFHKKHWDNVYTQIMGNQHQEWMRLILQTERNRDQVLEFYSKGRVRAGEGAVVENTNLKQKLPINSSSNGSKELNAAVHKSYNQAAAADAQQSLELIHFLRPTTAAANDVSFSASSEGVDTTAANIIALENSQITAASATVMSTTDTNTTLDPVLQRLYAGVGSNSFMRRKNPSASMNEMISNSRNNANTANPFNQNNIQISTSQTAYNASVNASTEVPKMKSESVFGSRVSTGRAPRGHTPVAYVNNVGNVSVRKSTGSIFSPDYMDTSASKTNGKEINMNAKKENSQARKSYGFGLDAIPRNPVLSRSIEKYDRLVADNTATTTINSNNHSHKDNNNSISNTSNVLHFLEYGGGRDQDGPYLMTEFDMDPAHTSEDENPRYMAPPTPLIQPDLDTKLNKFNDVRHSHPVPSSSSWKQKLGVNIDPYMSNLPTPQVPDPYASEVITPPPFANTLVKENGRINGRSSNPFGSTSGSAVVQRNPFDESDNNKKYNHAKKSDVDGRSSKNIRPSLISGKGLSRSVEIRKSRENLDIALERGLILGRGKGDTTSASVEWKSPNANVKVDLKGIRAFIAKVAADAQLLGFDPAELDQDGRALKTKNKKIKSKIPKTVGEALNVIFEAEVDSSDDISDDNDNNKDTSEDGDTDTALMQITDADIAAAHPWLRDVFFLGALPSDEDLMLPITSIKEEEDIKEVRTNVDLSHMNMKALQNRVHTLVATVDKARNIWSASISKHLRIKRRAENIVSRMKKCSSKAYSRVTELRGDINEVKIDCQKAADWIADTGSVLRAIDLERDKVSTMRDLLQVTDSQRSELIALVSQEEDKRKELEKACEEVASIMLGIDVEIENDRDLKRARAITKIRTKAIVLTRYLTATKRWFLRRLRTRVRRQQKIKSWYQSKQHIRHMRSYKSVFRGWIRYIVGERRLAVAFRWIRRQRTSHLFDQWLGTTRRSMLVKAMHTRRVRQLGRLVLRMWFQYTKSPRSQRGRALRYIDADLDDDEFNDDSDGGRSTMNDYNDVGSTLLTSYQMNSRRKRYRSLYMALYEPKLSSFIVLRAFRGLKRFYESCRLTSRQFDEGCRLARRHYYSRFLRAWFVAAIESRHKALEQQQHLLQFRTESIVRIAWKCWHLYVKSKVWGSHRVLTRSVAKLAIHTVIRVSVRRATEIGNRFSLMYPRRWALKQMKCLKEAVFLSRRHCRSADKAHIRCCSRKALLRWKQCYINAQFDLKEESKSMIHYFGGMRRRVFNAWHDCVMDTMMLRRKYLGYNTGNNRNSRVRTVLADAGVSSGESVSIGIGHPSALERPPPYSKTMMHMYGGRIYCITKPQQLQLNPLVGDDTDDDNVVEGDDPFDDDGNDIDGDDAVDMNLVETTRSKRRARLVKAMSCYRQRLIKMMGFSRLRRVCHKRSRLKMTLLIVKERSSINPKVNLKNTMTRWKIIFSRKGYARLESNMSLVEKNDGRDSSMEEKREALVGRIAERNDEIAMLQTQVDELNSKLNEKDGLLKGLVLQIDATEGGNMSARTAIADAEQLTDTMQTESNAVMLMVGGGESLLVPAAKRTITTKSSSSQSLIFAAAADDDYDSQEGSESKSTDEKEHELRKMRNELDLTEKKRNALFNEVESNYESAVQTQTEAQRKLSDLKAQRQEADQRRQRTLRLLADVDMSIEDLILQRNKVEDILKSCKAAVVAAAESEEERARKHNETLAAMNDEEKGLQRRREAGLLELTNRQHDLEALRQEIINKRYHLQLQHDSDVIIPTNALVLAQDIVSTTEVQYSQAERMLHALELDVAEAVSHTTNTISLNALTSSEGIAGNDIDTNTVNTTSTTNSNRREIDAHAMVLGAVEKENRYLRGQRAQELIDSKTASSSLFLRMAKEERLERNKNILDASDRIGAAHSSEGGVSSRTNSQISKKGRKGGKSGIDSKTSTSELNRIFTSLSRKKREYNSSPSSSTNSGDTSPRNRHRSSRKTKTKSMKEKETRNPDKNLSFTNSLISGAGSAMGNMSDSGYEAEDMPTLDDLRTNNEIKDITSRLLGGIGE